MNDWKDSGNKKGLEGFREEGKNGKEVEKKGLIGRMQRRREGLEKSRIKKKNWIEAEKKGRIGRK